MAWFSPLLKKSMGSRRSGAPKSIKLKAALGIKVRRWLCLPAVNSEPICLICSSFLTHHKSMGPFSVLGIIFSWGEGRDHRSLALPPRSPFSGPDFLRGQVFRLDQIPCFYGPLQGFTHHRFQFVGL